MFFLIENNFIERISGWSDTLSLIFSDFRRAWERDDSMIAITKDNGMNGQENINWKTKTLDDKHIIIERVN